MIDQSHNLKGKIEAMIQTVTVAQELHAKAALVDLERLRAAQAGSELVTAESLLQDAFATDVRPAIREMAVGKGTSGGPAPRVSRGRLSRTNHLGARQAQRRRGRVRTPDDSVRRRGRLAFRVLLNHLQQPRIDRIPRHASRRVLAKLVVFRPHQRGAVAHRDARLPLVHLHVAGKIRIGNRAPAETNDARRGRPEGWPRRPRGRSGEDSCSRCRRPGISGQARCAASASMKCRSTPTSPGSGAA